VIGLKLAPALRKLNRAHLASDVLYVASKRPEGTIVAQKPQPGTTVKRRGRVTVNVSTGPKPRPQKAVPDVTGQDENAATSALQGAGFQVQSYDQPTSDPSQDGIVVDEQPAGGTNAPAGSVVTIYVGRFTGTTTTGEIGPAPPLDGAGPATASAPGGAP
jgi:serine/threonine-protein kinase